MQMYRKYSLIANKYNLYLLDKETIAKELKKNLNFEEIFNDLKDKECFTIPSYVDNYIYLNLKEIYKNNFFFQYSIYLLSDYIFKNKKEFITFLQDIYNVLKDLDIEKLDIIYNRLKNIDKYVLSKEEKLEQEELAKNISNFFYDDRIISFLSNKFNDKHIQNQILEDNYSYGQGFEDIFLKSLILLDGKIDISEILKHSDTVEHIAEYTLNKILQKLDIKEQCNTSKLLLLNYLYKAYVENGYFFHGTTSNEIESIKKYGLNPQSFYFDSKIIDETNSIFEKYNLYRTFEGKVGEMYMFNFYVTDMIEYAIYYANQSPEYLSRFCANGHHMRDSDMYDTNAFWRRDYIACKENVIKFCKLNKFSDEDLKKVLVNFKEMFNRVVKKDQYPVIFFGKKKIIGRDTTLKYDVIKNNIEKYSFKDIFYHITMPVCPGSIHDKRLAKINIDNLSMISLPNIYRFYKIKSNEVLKKDKFVLCNGKKIKPDLLINVPFSKCLVIKIDRVDKIIYDNRCMIIPDDISKLQITISDNFFIQSIDVLITESAIPLTLKGKEVINKLREKYSIDDICSIYLDKINEMLKNEDVFELNTILQLIDNYFIKYASMKKYSDYYSNISSDKINIIHYKVDNNNMILKYIRTKLIDETTIKDIITNMDSYLKG